MARNAYAEKAKPATVKLEIACLRRMFRPAPGG
jgi:hypothetical protein